MGEKEYNDMVLIGKEMKNTLPQTKSFDVFWKMESGKEMEIMV